MPRDRNRDREFSEALAQRRPARPVMSTEAALAYFRARDAAAAAAAAPAPSLADDVQYFLTNYPGTDLALNAISRVFKLGIWRDLPADASPAREAALDELQVHQVALVRAILENTGLDVEARTAAAMGAAAIERSMGLADMAFFDAVHRHLDGHAPMAEALSAFRLSLAKFEFRDSMGWC